MVVQSNQSNMNMNLNKGPMIGEFAQSLEGESVVARPQGAQAIPAPPQLHQVEPGDLITAQYFNDLVLAIQNLQTRIAVLEEPPDYYRAEVAMAEAAS